MVSSIRKPEEICSPTNTSRNTHTHKQTFTRRNAHTKNTQAHTHTYAVCCTSIKINLRRITEVSRKRKEENIIFQTNRLQQKSNPSQTDVSATTPRSIGRSVSEDFKYFLSFSLCHCIHSFCAFVCACVRP